MTENTAKAGAQMTCTETSNAKTELEATLSRFVWKGPDGVSPLSKKQIPILYSNEASLCSQTARCILNLFGIPFEDVRMDLHFSYDHFTDWFAKINPKITVPVLKLYYEDGKFEYIRESYDIVRWAIKQMNYSNEEHEKIVKFINFLQTYNYKVIYLFVQQDKPAIMKLMYYKEVSYKKKMIAKWKTHHCPEVRAVAESYKDPAEQAAIDAAKLSDSAEETYHMIEAGLFAAIIEQLKTSPYLLDGDQPGPADACAFVFLNRTLMIFNHPVFDLDGCKMPQELIEYYDRLKVHDWAVKSEVYDDLKKHTVGKFLLKMKGRVKMGLLCLLVVVLGVLIMLWG